MEKPVRAFYKARITYKNPAWKDGLNNTGMAFSLEEDIVLMPPPDRNLDVMMQHTMAQNMLTHFWSGNIPLSVNQDVYIHPNRIIKIEIVKNIEIAVAKTGGQAVVG